MGTFLLRTGEAKILDINLVKLKENKVPYSTKKTRCSFSRFQTPTQQNHKTES